MPPMPSPTNASPAHHRIVEDLRACARVRARHKQHQQPTSRISVVDTTSHASSPATATSSQRPCRVASSDSSSPPAPRDLSNPPAATRARLGSPHVHAPTRDASVAGGSRASVPPPELAHRCIRGHVSPGSSRARGASRRGVHERHAPVPGPLGPTTARPPRCCAGRSTAARARAPRRRPCWGAPPAVAAASSAGTSCRP